MRLLTLLLIVAVLVCFGCAGGALEQPVLPSHGQEITAGTGSVGGPVSTGQFLNWGVYRLEIARDGSHVRVIPDRYASVEWGYHLNAVKLLEVDPCTHCLWTSNAHLLPNGDLSIDIHIKHPFDNPVYTGFDVRGIIMFPSSQLFPDNELREAAGIPPWDEDSWYHRISCHEKGDAELMNAEGWVTIFSPDFPDHGFQDLEDGYPIFDYYPGKYASGENLGTINAYRRFYSNENRHMFETGKTVTRTYIIRPPAVGPIEASYAIYAHWAPPLRTPVANPAVDFGPDANSPVPYEFWVWQDEVIDPDANHNEKGLHIHWHVKTWDIGYAYWSAAEHDLMYYENYGCPLEPHPSGEPDDYWFPPGFHTGAYELLPDAYPGEWPYLFRLWIGHPDHPWSPPLLGAEWYIAKIAIDEIDGES